MYTITAIENAIITALAPLKISLGVRTIKSYQAELDSEDDIAKAARLFPAIIVVYTGSAYEEHGARKIERMSYTLFVCDKNLRAEEEGRQGGVGTGKNPGTYAMLNAVRNLLFGKQLGLPGLFPIALKREDPVFLGLGLSIYGAEYETAQALLYPS